MSALSRRLPVFVALLMAVAVVAPAATAQVNRNPVANPGPDQTTDESPPGTGASPTNCANVIDPTNSGSPERLYLAAPSTLTPTVVHLTGQNSYDADDVDPPAYDQITYYWRQVNKPLGTSGSQAPDLCLIPGEDIGLEDVIVPNLRPFDAPSYTYTIRLVVADVALPADGVTTLTPTPGPDHEASYCASAPTACRTISFVVRNSNQAPVFSVSPPPFASITPASIDLIDNRANNVGPPMLPSKVTFTMSPIVDDRETTAVIVTLTDEKIANHTLTVPLNKLACAASPCVCPNVTTCIDSASHQETSHWVGTLDVDTPEFTTGTYDVTAQAFDQDGASAVTEAGSREIDVSASLADKRLPFVSLNQLPSARPHADSCFPGVDRVSPRVFGPGTILRPEIFFYPLTDPALYIDAAGKPVQPPERPDDQLLLRKVTYQLCFQTGSSPGVGPEVPLPAPYYLGQETLFAGQSDIKDLVVKVTAYDRQGRTSSTAIPLSVGLEQPTFFVDRPDVNYQGIPSPFTVYVQDRVDAAAQLKIDDFPGYNVRVTNNLTATPAHTHAFTMPPLSSTIKYDTDGDGKCELLIDSNSDGKLDMTYSPLNLTLGVLLSSPSKVTGVQRDYIIDTNHNGIGDVGERLLLGNKTTVIDFKGALPCALPFSAALQDFLNRGPNQVFVFELTRTTLGVAHSVLTINDVVLNLNAQSYTFNYAGGALNQTLEGTFRTEKASTDAQVVAGSAGTAGPYLPGDLVALNATVRHVTTHVPPPRPSLNVTYQDGTKKPSATVHTPQLDTGVKQEVAFTPREFSPGLHSITFNVSMTSLVNETSAANNAFKGVDFEVYLGEVVQGTSVSSGKQYFIRADQNGLPLAKDGAVELGTDGKVLRSHDLKFTQAPNVRYTFEVVDKDGKNQTLGWDPLARYSLAFGKDCRDLSATQAVVNHTANPMQDPLCRPITLLNANGAQFTTTTKASPGLEFSALTLVLAAVGVRSRRRQD